MITAAEFNVLALWFALPLVLLSGGLLAAQGVILNLRGRTRPGGSELRWVCGALTSVAILGTWIHTPVLFLFLTTIAISLVLIGVSRLRAEWRDRSREVFA